MGEDVDVAGRDPRLERGRDAEVVPAEAPADAQGTLDELTHHLAETLAQHLGDLPLLLELLNLLREGLDLQQRVVASPP